MKKQKSNKHIRPKAYRRAVEKHTLRSWQHIGPASYWYHDSWSIFEHDWDWHDRYYEYYDDYQDHCKWCYGYTGCIKVDVLKSTSRLFKKTGWDRCWDSYKEEYGV